MKTNMGTTDRVIRVVIALAILLLWYFGVLAGTLGYILLVVAAIFVLTGFVSFCPIYAIFGVNTCKKKVS